MNINDFLKELNLEGRALSIMLSDDYDGGNAKIGGGCSLALLKKCFAGETIVFSDSGAGGCKGMRTGMGLSDGIPDIPGGFGYFLTCGKGEGFPQGERIKSSPDVAERLILEQPQEVLGGKRFIIVKPYAEGDNAETVTFLVNPDQLAALVHLHAFRTPAYDTTIAPMVSGCASVFRVPFGERGREHPRAVIGNIDIFSRPHFDANSFFYTVTHKSLLEMLEDADECFFKNHLWGTIKKRL